MFFGQLKLESRSTPFAKVVESLNLLSFFTLQFWILKTQIKRANTTACSTLSAKF